MSRTNSENFWKYVKIKKDGCWDWFGFKNKKGYGRFSFNKKIVMAHRFIYEYLIGEIPKNMTVNHDCENKKCVNPDHLTLMTQKENNNFSMHPQSIKTHCVNGHEFTPMNTRIRGKSWRVCRTCHREQEKDRKVKKKLLVMTN